MDAQADRVTCPGCGATFVPGEEVADVSGEATPPHARENEPAPTDDPGGEPNESDERPRAVRRNKYFNRRQG